MNFSSKPAHKNICIARRTFSAHNATFFLKMIYAIEYKIIKCQNKFLKKSYQKCLSDKLTAFPKGSNLVLTFDRINFLSFLCPLLPVAALAQVL